MKERMQRIAEYRMKQPIEELERKWAKAKGRTNRYSADEWFDLRIAKARVMYRQLNEENSHE